MNIAIVDDLQEDRDRLYRQIRRFWDESFLKTQITCYAGAEQFCAAEDLRALDLVFLDIYMPGVSGIELAEQIRSVNPDCMFVLVSTSKDFIHESYDLGALYYLIKPYADGDIQKVLRLVRAQKAMRPQTVEFLTAKDRILLRTGDILYVDLLRHYVQFHLKNEVIKTYTLKFADVQKALASFPCFLVCFRCILVNMEHVDKIDGRDFVLSNGERLPIKREWFAQVQNTYTNYLFALAHA